MKIIDKNQFSGTKLDEVISYADEIQKKDLEGKINAHEIYTSIISSIPVDYDKGLFHIRGSLREKIWKLERYFGWNKFFFSQFGQDKFILDNFFKNLKNGFFVEIGAYDGINGSNCFHFEKFLGWNGIAIEPSINQFEKLKNNRSCQCVNKAISDKKEKVEFVDVTDGLKMMSGLNKNFYQKTLEIIKNDKRSKTKIYNVETATFKEIIKDNKNIDYLSIDIEGGELSLLETIDFDFYNIKILSLENNTPNVVKYNQLLERKNFKFFDYIGVDEIYFNKKYFNL